MSNRIYVLKDEDRLDEVCALFATGLGETTRAHWKWRIFTPNGQLPPEAVVIENEQRRLVGMLSVLPELYGDRAQKCAQLCDWVIHPDFRGQGLLGKLYRYTFERYAGLGFDFMVGFPNVHAYPILQKYSFEEKEPIGSWNTAKKPLAFKRPAEDIDFEGLAYRFTPSCPLSSFPTRPDRIFRTPEYMRWKYDANPDVSFQWLVVWERAQPIGYFVYTCTQGRLRTAVNVYDWEFEPTAQEAFRKAIGLLGRLGNYVSIWGRYGEKERKLLQGAGMTEGTGRTKYMLKTLSEKGYPDPLTLTRLDTDY